ncbi:hypothetical protein T06_12784 [Trichinella sp. T6]|nr:hypothetical protein T06_12784 [Trichinella sp. T6]
MNGEQKGMDGNCSSFLNKVKGINLTIYGLSTWQITLLGSETAQFVSSASRLVLWPLMDY